MVSQPTQPANEQGQVHEPVSRFGRVPLDLLHNTSITDGAVRLYAHMLWRFGKNHQNFEGRTSMAIHLDVSEATITNRIAELVRDDWVIAVPRAVVGQGRKTNFYHVFLRQKDCRAYRTQHNIAKPDLSLEDVPLRKNRKGTGGRKTHRPKVNSSSHTDVNSSSLMGVNSSSHTVATEQSSAGAGSEHAHLDTGNYLDAFHLDTDIYAQSANASAPGAPDLLGSEIDELTRQDLDKALTAEAKHAAKKLADGATPAKADSHVSLSESAAATTESRIEPISQPEEKEKSFAKKEKEAEQFINDWQYKYIYPSDVMSQLSVPNELAAELLDELVLKGKLIKTYRADRQAEYTLKPSPQVAPIPCFYVIDNTTAYGPFGNYKSAKTYAGLHGLSQIENDASLSGMTITRPILEKSPKQGTENPTFKPGDRVYWRETPSKFGPPVPSNAAIVVSVSKRWATIVTCQNEQPTEKKIGITTLTPRLFGDPFDSTLTTYLMAKATAGKKPPQPHIAKIEEWMDAVGRDTIPAGVTVRSFVRLGKAWSEANEDTACAGAVYRSYLDGLPGKPVLTWDVAEVTIATRLALQLCKNGITADDVARFMRNKFGERDEKGNVFWHGKFMPFQYVANNVAAWKSNQGPVSQNRPKAKPDCPDCKGLGTIISRDERGQDVARRCNCMEVTHVH